MKSEEGKSIQEWWDSFSERVKSKIDGQFVGGSMMQIAELRLEDE